MAASSHALHNAKAERSGRTPGSVAGTTATAAATTTAGETTGRSGRAGAGRDEHGKLDSGLLAGALGAGNLLLLVDHNLLEALVTAITDVFVNGHVENLSGAAPLLGQRRES